MKWVTSRAKVKIPERFSWFSYTKSKLGSRHPGPYSPRYPRGMCLCWRSRHQTRPHRRSAPSQRSPCSCSSGCCDASWWPSAPRRCPSRQPWTSKEGAEKEERKETGEKTENKRNIYLENIIGVVMIYTFFFLFKDLFIDWLIEWLLCWVFVSVLGLSLVVASGGHSSSRCAGLSLSRPLPLRSTGSRRAGSVAVAYGPSCSAACGILPDQGPNPCPLHWQADSQPLHHQGSPLDIHF